MDLSNEDIEEILQILDSTEYGDLRIKTSRFALELSRDASGQWSESRQLLSEARVDKLSVPEAGSALVANTDIADRADADGLLQVLSPLPGTFYRAPSPGAAPFVEVGDMVEEDSVICIVETMKLMNSIRAGARGRVARICVENAQPAEKGGCLFLIEPQSA